MHKKLHNEINKQNNEMILTGLVPHSQMSVVAEVPGLGAGEGENVHPLVLVGSQVARVVLAHCCRYCNETHWNHLGLLYLNCQNSPNCSVVGMGYYSRTQWWFAHLVEHGWHSHSDCVELFSLGHRVAHYVVFQSSTMAHYEVLFSGPVPAASLLGCLSCVVRHGR